MTFLHVCSSIGKLFLKFDNHKRKHKVYSFKNNNKINEKFFVRIFTLIVEIFIENYKHSIHI